jgi:hypothetical protein
MNLTAIVDSVGRVVLGRHDQENSTKAVLKLKNPAVVNIQVDQQSGQISVQLIPYIFKEFVKSDLRDVGITWSFQRSAVVVSDDLVLEDNIVSQYEKIFESTPEEVELFDEASTEEAEEDTEEEAAS